MIGLHADVDAALTASGLPPRPQQLEQQGSAQVWTIAGQTELPIAVVSARDAGALRALLRPLPHYGSQSWLVFEGSRALRPRRLANHRAASAGQHGRPQGRRLSALPMPA
jgi:aminopeptidase N